MLSPLRAGLSLCTIASLSILAASGLVEAQTYRVTSAGDDGPGTLRQAIASANVASGPATIDLADGLGTIRLQSALPIITRDVTINGGSGNAVSGAGQNRIFFVDAPSSTVAISHLLLLDGRAKGGDGGSGGGGGGGLGGALFVNAGNVTASDVRFAGNSAVGGSGGIGVSGGGGGLGGDGGGGNPTPNNYYTTSGGGGGGGIGGRGGNGGFSGSIWTANDISGGGGGGTSGNGGSGASTNWSITPGGGGGGSPSGHGGDGKPGVAGSGNGSGGGGGLENYESYPPSQDPSRGQFGFAVGNGVKGGPGGGGGGGASYSEGGNGGDGGSGAGGGGGGNAAEGANGGRGGFGGGGAGGGHAAVGGNGGAAGFGGGGGAGGGAAEGANGGAGGFGGGGGAGGSAAVGANGGSGGFGGGGGGAPDLRESIAGTGGAGGTHGFKADNSDVQGGGGGAALGGALFVRSDNGASLKLIDSSTDQGSLTAGRGGANGGDGLAAGSSLFLMGARQEVAVTGNQVQSVAGSIAESAPSGLSKLGSGTLILSGNNGGPFGYSGGTNVADGTLLVNNPSGSGTGSGAVTVLANAILGGTGSIAGDVTIQAGGHLLQSQAGFESLKVGGNLMLEPDSVLHAALGSSSPIEVGKLLDVEGLLDLSSDPTIGAGSYTLFHYGSLGSMGLTVEGASKDYLYFIRSDADKHEIELVISDLRPEPVPEPATWLVMLLGSAATLVAHQRHRSNASIDVAP